MLLPFSLVNVAGWMLRGGEGEADGHEKAWSSAVWWTRLVLTSGGIVLTVAYILWSAVALMDVLAYQCGNDNRCVDNRSWLLPLRLLGGDPVWRITLGALAVALVVLALLFAARRTQRHEQYEPDDRRRHTYGDEERGDDVVGRLRRNDNLKHPGFWYKPREYATLFYWHAYTAVVVLGAVYGYSLAAAGAQDAFDDRTGEAAANIWSVIVIALALIALSAVTGRLRKLTDRSRPTLHLISLAAVTIAAVGGGLAGWLWQDMTGAGSSPVEGGLGLMTGVWGLYVVEFALLIVGIAPIIANFWSFVRWERFSKVRPPKSDGFRFMAPVGVVTFALIVANGGFGAVVVRLVDLLDRGSEELVEVGIVSAGLPVDIFAAAVLIGVIALAVPLLPQLLPGQARTDSIGDEYPDVWKMSVRKKIVRFRALSQVGRNVDRMFTIITVVTMLYAGWIIFRLIDGYYPLDERFPDLVKPLLGFGGGTVGERIRDSVALGMILYVFPGAFLIRAGYQNLGTRRQVGKIWESITFFPRRFHPLGAPCYAEKAVPMLRERIRLLSRSQARLVIRAHSQGTVLTYAALAQLIGEEDDPKAWLSVRTGTVDCMDPLAVPGFLSSYRPADDGAEQGEPSDAREPARLTQTALVTMGSPMGQLHEPYFPNYFCHSRFEEARKKLLGWENFYRETDYIGKALFVHRDSILDEAGNFEVAVGPDEDIGTKPSAPDHCLRDPREGDDVLHTHIRYPDDTAVEAQIAAFVSS